MSCEHHGCFEAGCPRLQHLHAQLHVFVPAGDHLSAGYTPGEDLAIFTDFNWFSVPRQVESVRKLLYYDWLHVMPGHGRPVHLHDSMHRLKAVTALLTKHGAEVTEKQEAAAHSTRTGW